MCDLAMISISMAFVGPALLCIQGGAAVGPGSDAPELASLSRGNPATHAYTRTRNTRDPPTYLHRALYIIFNKIKILK